MLKMFTTFLTHTRTLTHTHILVFISASIKDLEWVIINTFLIYVKDIVVLTKFTNCSTFSDLVVLVLLISWRTSRDVLETFSRRKLQISEMTYLKIAKFLKFSHPNDPVI